MDKTEGIKRGGMEEVDGARTFRNDSSIGGVSDWSAAIYLSLCSV
jgi:hypothetical protein